MARTKKVAVVAVPTTEVENTKKHFGLDALVRAEAMKTEFDNPTHHDICVELVKLADSFNDRDEKGHFLKEGFTHSKKGVSKPFPMTFLVYFAVSTEAHKESVFNKGYTKIDVEAAKAILRMLKFWGKYNNNPNLSRNDKVVHAITKYYKKVSPKMADFKKDVEQYWQPWDKAPKTMKEVTIGLHIDFPQE